MSSEPLSLEHSLIPEESVHPRGEEFFAQVSEMLDGQPKVEAVVEARLAGWEGLIERIASDLYRIGSMLLGEGEETIQIIEKVVIHNDISACSDHVEARHNARLLLAAEAIAVLERRDPASFVAPVGEDGPVSCIEDDDLDSVGVTHAELERMLSGPDDHRLRDWLESLTVSLRVIFVLRAIAGLSSAEVAGLLAEHGGAEAQDWTPDAVRSTFRQALCGLASQLIHASAAK